MTFTYLDAIFLGIIAIFVVIGLFRGFVRSVLNFFGLFSKLILSFFLCKPIGNLICKWTTWDESWADGIKKWASGLSDSFNTNLAGLNSEDLSSQVSTALSDARFPKLLRALFKSLINVTPETISGETHITMADIIGVTFSRLAIYAIMFVIVFILLFIAIFILKRLIKKFMQNHKTINKTDKTLGAVLGLIEGLFTIVSIFAVVSLFKNADFMVGFFNTLNKSCIAGPVSNFMYNIVVKYFNISKFI